MMLRLAEIESKKSNQKYKLGAVIGKGRRVLASAFNDTKTDPNFGSGKYNTLHAEGRVIKKAIRSGHDIRGATIYIYRKNGLLAWPCPDCLKMINNAGISRIVST